MIWAFGVAMRWATRRAFKVAALFIAGCVAGPIDEVDLWRKIDGATFTPARFAIRKRPETVSVVVESTDPTEGLLLASGDEGPHELGFRISQPGTARIQVDTRFGDDMKAERIVYGFDQVALAFPRGAVDVRHVIYISTTRGPLEVWSFYLNVWSAEE